MAIISKDNIYLQPTLYFPIIHGHAKELSMESSGISGQVANWSKVEVGVLANKINPDKNSISLSNGKTFTYKSLVLATGFDHKLEYIKGLEQFSKCHESENVFIHIMDHKSRYFQNYYNGWNHKAGDFICYSPKFPYKGEGTDFYALYYESFLRMDKLQTTSAAGARIQYYTPNKEIYQFPYANEVALDECHKRGIDVCFGWEMLEVKKDQYNQKIAVFRNVDSGEIMEKPFWSACINPPSKPQSLITDAGLGDEHGLVDVNKYTLQHEKYENIFALGDCIGGDGMTRTHEAAMRQNPVVKNNVLKFLQGKEVNGIYDGYTYMPLYLASSNSTNFQHLHDFEPAQFNHYVPHHGVFSQLYFKAMLKRFDSEGKKYASYKKTQGPPHYSYANEYDALEHNEYLQSHQIPLESVIHEVAQARIARGEENPVLVINDHHH